MQTGFKSAALAATAAAICLAGCSETYRGPDPIVTARGTVAIDGTSSGLTRLFFQSAEGSYAAPGDSALARQMLSDGFALIYSNCNDYFRDAGRTQQRLLFARDLLGTIGTLATGVIAVAHASKDATAIAALVTSTGYSVTDDIAKDFLFSADNIESVRDLTLRALQADQANVLSPGSSQNFSYQTAVMYLEDDQNFCTLRKIAELVKEAVTNAPLRNGPPSAPAQLTGSAESPPPVAAPPPSPHQPAAPPPIAAPAGGIATFRHIPVHVAPLTR
jgi:hypothetical protein